MSSTVSFGGLASGLNTASIISQLMSLNRIPEQLLQAQQKKNSDKVSEFQKIEDSLTSLQTVVQGFNTPASFNTLKTSISDSSVISATATTAAIAGTHTVQVTSLAKNERQVSVGVASASDLNFNTGTFTIDGGSPIAITQGQNSLNGVVAAINNAGGKVSAYIVNDGTSSGNRMVINGTDGKDHIFDFSGMTQAPASGSGGQPTLLGSGDASYQAATPAVITVDGVSMTKTSNTVTDAVQGVTINLLKEGSTTTFSVANDTDAVTAKINNFVAAYNKAITLVNSESAYDSTSNTAGVLSGNSTVSAIQQQLRSLLTTTVEGSRSTINSLLSLGINSDSTTGTLSVDSTKLSDALSNHYSEVVDYMTHNGDSFATLPQAKYGMMQQFNMSIDSMVHPFIMDGYAGNGTIEVAKRTLTTTNSDMDTQISQMEARLTQMQTNMENQFNAMETVISGLQTQGNAMLSMLGVSTSSSSKTSG